jgi:hypothetical protein
MLIGFGFTGRENEITRYGCEDKYGGSDGWYCV